MIQTNGIKKLVRLLLHFGFSWRKHFSFSWFDRLLLELYYWSVQPSICKPRFCGEVEFELRFDQESQSPLRVKYGILNKSLQRRWLEVFREDFQSLRQLWFDGMFFGKLYTNETATERELVGLVRQLSTHIQMPEHFLKLTSFSDADLNALHQFKEDWTRKRDSELSEVDAILDHINYVIHRLEFNRTEYARPQTGGINCVYLPPTKRSFSWFDNLEFSPISDLGGLYMDYGTNGVPMLDGFWGEVQHAAVPQEDLNSGCKLYFYDRPEKIPLRDFECWARKYWQTTALDLQSRIGHICLGYVLHENPHELRLKTAGAHRIRVTSVKFN